MNQPVGFSAIATLNTARAGSSERQIASFFFALHAVVRSWRLSGDVLLDSSTSGFDPQNEHGRSKMFAAQIDH
jgi:hypothetical protein